MIRFCRRSIFASLLLFPLQSSKYNGILVGTWFHFQVYMFTTICAVIWLGVCMPKVLNWLIAPPSWFYLRVNTTPYCMALDLVCGSIINVISAGTRIVSPDDSFLYDVTMLSTYLQIKVGQLHNWIETQLCHITIEHALNAKLHTFAIYSFRLCSGWEKPHMGGTLPWMFWSAKHNQNQLSFSLVFSIPYHLLHL